MLLYVRGWDERWRLCDPSNLADTIAFLDDRADYCDTFWGRIWTLELAPLDIVSYRLVCPD